MENTFDEMYAFETHWQSRSGEMVPHDVTSIEGLPTQFHAQIGSNSRAMLYAGNLRIAEITPKNIRPRSGEFQNIFKISKEEFIEIMINRQLPSS